ncbi:periplasmic binding protein [Methanosarcina barkeri 3]|uniref:Periplasmic binding protein n=1 Tax=Methanosarcina barkeri 3 TaxID=1434107 RepID=A0A0E3SPD4_METBA|nr:ABC transporter substrate-binding protein [Methanosarcina barkeri]AKB83563.1 periplasmic binding protein [Methanosarcina barkeri 3]
MNKNNSIVIAITFIIFVMLVAGLFLLSDFPKKPTENNTITVTDLAGRTVSLKVPAERVVLGSSRDLHEFAAIEGENFSKKIVGWGPDLKDTDKDTYDKFKEKYPEIENIPDVGSFSKGTFSVEKVVSLNPDLFTIPLWDYEKAKDDIERLEQAGIPVIVIDFWAKPLDNPPKSVILMGKLLGKEKRANEIADFYNDQTNIVYSRIAKITRQKPTVYVECGWKGSDTYGNSYSNVGWGELINRSGGSNIAGNFSEQMPTINPEFLLDKDPDIIIISGANWPAAPSSLRLGYYTKEDDSRELLKGYLNRPGWNTLKAVQNENVYGVFHGCCFRIYNYAALQAFAKWFYPEDFKDINPEAGIKEYHEKFMPIDYSGTWILELKES